MELAFAGDFYAAWENDSVCRGGVGWRGVVSEGLGSECE
jgi:hypothetical protein